MKRFFIFIITLLLFCGCGTQRRILPSTDKEVRVETILQERIDTVYVTLPREIVEVVRRDSSYLETSIAESSAVIDSLGLLHHTLKNKDMKLPVTVKEVEKIIIKDSLIVHKEPVEVTVIKHKIPNSYWIMMALLILIIGVKIYKIFRFVV